MMKRKKQIRNCLRHNGRQLRSVGPRESNGREIADTEKICVTNV
jgi:hypothetical protein